MTNEEISLELLSAYLDDELTGTVRKQVVGAVLTSRATKERLAQLQAIKQRLAAPLPPAPDIDVRAAVLSSLSRRTRAPRSFGLAEWLLRGCLGRVVILVEWGSRLAQCCSQACLDPNVAERSLDRGSLMTFADVRATA